MDRRLVIIALLVLLCSQVGCGKRLATVQGTVTVDNVEVEKGMVTFTPVGGKGSVVGANIEKGKYVARGVEPGSNVVNVIAVKAVTFARSSEEMAAMSAKQKEAGNASGLIDPADEIPANAEGNNKTYEIELGNIKLDLAIKRPGK